MSWSKTPQELAKRCQIGVPRGPNAYDELHSILAECYGTINRLLLENEGMRRGEFICTKCWLRKDSDHGRTHEF